MYHLCVAVEQGCFGSTYEKQVGENVMSPGAGSQVLVPKMNFSCNGAITTLIVNLTKGSTGSNNNDDNNGDDEENDQGNGDKKRKTDITKSFPRIEVWRPSNSSYFKMDCYILSADDINSEEKLANVSLINEPMKFQSGDVIGYYIPTGSAYSIQNIPAMGNTSYSITTNNALDKFTINGNVTVSGMLPIIQVVVGKLVTSTIYCSN